MDLKSQIFQVITKEHLVKRADTVLVGVSGGADSVCLLHVLYELRLKLGVSVHIVHFNHRIRKSANADEVFVKNLALKLGLPVTISRRPGALKLSKTVSEDRARQWRLDFFAKTAKQVGAASIALAHTQNDLAETVLMRLLRGSGLLGLRGILTENQLEGLCVIRPLLGVKRSQIESYLKKHGLKHVHDETNDQTHYLRNKVRLKLLPELVKEYNPNLMNVLVDLAYTAQADYDYLSAQAKLLYNNLKVSKGGVLIPLKFFLKQSPAMQRMLLRMSFESIVLNLDQLGVSHIQEAEDLAYNRPAGSVVHWPQSVRILKTKDNLQLKRV